MIDKIIFLIPASMGKKYTNYILPLSSS